ncbi:MAG: putative signal transducing protein [Planctomycetota bacterium]|jgi:hypothetical protein
MADKLVTIAWFEDSIEASLAKQMLEDSEIKSILAGQNASNIYAGLPAIGAVELQVMESDVQKALEILNSQKNQEQQ